MNIREYLRNELFRASFILLILINIANFLNYLFHFIMGRMLGPANYGILAMLTSIIYIFSIPTNAIQTLVAKNTIKFNVEKNYGKIKGMLKFMIIEASILALILFIIFGILAFGFAETLGVSFSLLALTGLYLFGAFFSPIGIGILQGMKKFFVWGWNSILNSIIKIVIAVSLVLLGWGIYGPIIGFLVGIFVSFIFIFPFIKEVMQSKEIKERIPMISRNNIGILSAMLVITLMYSLDIIFAKIFFSPDIAGKYSVASMIGKIIFFGTASISGAMFPISSERYLKENKENTRGVIKKTFFIISALCIIAVLGLVLFPKLIINLLFGKAYLDIYNILAFIGVAFSFLALANTYVLYKLSISEFRIKHSIILAFFLALQISAFIFFRSSLKSFSTAFMASAIITFLGSMVLIRAKRE